MSGPRFVDNREGNTFAKSICGHLEALRRAGESPKELCIATGYFNAVGWLKVAKEGEQLEKVRPPQFGGVPLLSLKMSLTGGHSGQLQATPGNLTPLAKGNLSLYN